MHYSAKKDTFYKSFNWKLKIINYTKKVNKSYFYNFNFATTYLYWEWRTIWTLFITNSINLNLLLNPYFYKFIQCISDSPNKYYMLFEQKFKL